MFKCIAPTHLHSLVTCASVEDHPPKNSQEAHIGLEVFEKEKKRGHTARWTGKRVDWGIVWGGDEYDQSVLYETLKELIKYLERKYLNKSCHLKHKELLNERACQSL